MGLLERIAQSREVRYSADQWYGDYLQPSQWNPYSAQLVQTLAGNRASEIVSTLPSYAAALRNCPPAFAAQLFRGMVLSQARFTFRNLPFGGPNARRMFGQSALGILEKPWTGATTGELIARMEWHAGAAGNAFVYRKDRLRVLRPDWVAIVYGSEQEPEDAAHALDGELLGYIYCNGGIWGGNQPRSLLPADVAHWSPIPDPENVGVGMSWITPAIREIQSDQLSTTHKIRFFENGATPNLVVKGIPAATKEQFDQLVSMMEEKHAGVANAYRTLYLTAGADATVVGADMKQLDFKAVQGASETRIASLSRVPAVLLGISEGLQGSSLNAGNFGSARRTFADTWLYPALQDLAAALAPIIDVPKGAELWFDTKDIPLLREDGKDAAEIASLEASTIRQLGDAGYTPESIVAAVLARDWTLLKHSGLYSVQLQPAGAQEKDNGVDDLKAKIEALGGLFRAGFDPAASLALLGLPGLKHSGLLPVTLARKDALPEQPTEKQPDPKADPAPARQVDGLRHMPGKHNQANHAGLRRRLAAGVVSRQPLGEGAIAEAVELVELADGSRAVRKKSKRYHRFSPRRLTDAEELGAITMRAFGIPAPEVHRTADDEIYMDYIPGRLGSEVDNPDYDSDRGRIIGLVDQLMNNSDRHAGNWIDTPDGPVPIDHSTAFVYNRGDQPVPSWDEIQLFSWRLANLQGEWVDNDLSPQDIETARERLASVRQDFIRLGRINWYETMARRLELIGEHATGTAVRLR